MIPDMILRIGLHVSDLILTVFSLHSVLRIVFVEFNMWVGPIIVNGPSTIYLFFVVDHITTTLGVFTSSISI